MLYNITLCNIVLSYSSNIFFYSSKVVLVERKSNLNYFSLLDLNIDGSTTLGNVYFEAKGHSPKLSYDAKGNACRDA